MYTSLIIVFIVVLVAALTSTVTAFTLHFSGRHLPVSDFSKPAAVAAASSREATSLSAREPDHFFVVCQNHRLDHVSSPLHETHHIPQHPSSPQRRTHSAYLVFASPQQLQQPGGGIHQERCAVQRMDPMQDKIAPELLLQEATNLIGLYISISLETSPTAAQRVQQARRIAKDVCDATDLLLRCVVEDHSPGLVRAVLNSTRTSQSNGSTVLSASLLRRLASHRHVRRIAPAVGISFENNVATLTVQSTLLDSSSSSGKKKNYHRTMWGHGVTGEGQLVAIADTGVDFDMCFFHDPKHPTPAFWPKTNMAHRKIFSYRPCVDYEYRVDHSDKAHAHGTHVAGSLVGERYDVSTAGDGLGDAHDSGMAKGAKLFFSDVQCGASNGIMVPHDAYDLFAPGREAGARVHSNSWGFDFPQVTTAYEAIDRQTDRFAFEHRAEMLLVFAAGNNPAHHVLKPGSSKNVLTVGAHINSVDRTQRGRLAAFSANGPTYDGRLKPEICGPGQNVRSADSDGMPSTHNCDTEVKSGTSMATPHIAGAGVLARQYFADGFFPYGWRGSGPAVDLPAAALKALLVTGAYPLSGVGGARPNSQEGFGGLNLEEILRFDDRSESERKQKKTTHLAIVEADSVSEGKQHEYCVTLDSSSSSSSMRDFLRVSLAWMDPPLAAEGSHHSLVNDLDLLLIHPDGSVVHSNNGGGGPVSNSNTEQIVIPHKAQTGGNSFLIVVRGEHVVTEKQEFSLAALGMGIKLVKRGGDGDGAPTDSCSAFKCPKACSGRGTCSGGVCKCSSSKLTGIDCSACSDAEVCHGNGRCKVGTNNNNNNVFTCDCDTAAFPHLDTTSAAAAAKTCGTCKSGFFGPSCLSSCDCSGHGQCDHSTGLCNCVASPSTGYWAPSSSSAGERACSRCAFDYTRVQSKLPAFFPHNPPAACTSRSFWCTNRAPRNIRLNESFPTGVLQVSDLPRYDNSMTCVWRIEAASPRAVVHFTFLTLKIEKPFDCVKIYTSAEMATLSSPPGAAVRPEARVTGSDLGKYNGGKPFQSQANVMYVVFESDFIGPDAGFEAEFTSQRVCNSETCHGRGVCNSANGECGCEGHFDPGTDCEKCVAGWTGSDCSQRGTSSPSSSSGPATTASPSASSSPSADRYLLSQCYSGDGVQCSGHGSCSPSVGRCVCDAFHGGFLCEKRCPSFEGVLCGGGRCLPESATCSCQDAAVVASLSTLPLKLKQSSLVGSTCQMLADNVMPLGANYPVFGPAVVPILRNQPGVVVGNNKKLDPHLRGTLGTPIFTAAWPEGEVKSVAHISIFARRVVPAASSSSGTQQKSASSSSSSSSSPVATDPLDVPFRVEAFRDWSVIGTRRKKKSSSSSSSSNSGDDDEEVGPDATWMSYDSGPICMQLHHHRRLDSSKKERLAVAVFAQTEVLDVFVLVSFDPTFKCGGRAASLLSSSSSQQQDAGALDFLRRSLTIVSDNSVTDKQLLTAPPSDLAVIMMVGITTLLVGAVLAALCSALHAQARRRRRAPLRKGSFFRGGGGGEDGQRLQHADDDEDDDEQDLGAWTHGGEQGVASDAPEGFENEDDDEEFINDPVVAQEMSPRGDE